MLSDKPNNDRHSVLLQVLLWIFFTETQAVVLADTTQWLVETNDLTEIDKVGVQIGQAVTITSDALPDLEISGEVLQISDFYQENRGDITYKTLIHLEPMDAALFWGMTVLIDFKSN
jgi:HlyD family secretion protein